MPTQSGAQTIAASDELSNGYANYVLGVLFIVYVFNFMDRQVLSIVLEDIKQDIQLSDTYMGFLGGFAFSLMYTIAGIPIARYADRASRRNVVTVGLLVWTTFTAITAYVGSFAQLFAARIGVGIGEAAGSPPSHSMISDYFSPHRRATALSVYGMGVYIGVAAAMIFGGTIASHFGWRSVYLAIGIAGVPLALLVRFSVRELPRGFSDRTSASPVPVAVQPPFVATIRRILSIRSLMLIIAGTAVQSLGGYGIMLWGAPFMMRIHGMSQLDVGLALGLIFGIAGCGGVISGAGCPTTSVATTRVGTCVCPRSKPSSASRFSWASCSQKAKPLHLPASSRFTSSRTCTSDRCSP